MPFAEYAAKQFLRDARARYFETNALGEVRAELGLA